MYVFRNRSRKKIIMHHKIQSVAQSIERFRFVCTWLLPPTLGSLVFFGIILGHVGSMLGTHLGGGGHLLEGGIFGEHMLGVCWEPPLLFPLKKSAV